MTDFVETLETAVVPWRQRMLGAQFFRALKDGTLKRDHYARFLVEIYHYVKHSTRLLAVAAGRLGPERQRLFARFVEHMAEEAGHDQWALNDLKTLGVDPARVVQSTPLPATDAMVGFQYFAIEHLGPISILGYIYALETLGSGTATQVGETLKRVLGIGDDALTFLLAHGEADVGHVEKLKTFVRAEAETAADRALVQRTAICTYHLYESMMDGIWTAAEQGASV
jgi:pyrroloquinoline quinone (PQQ) biosynthesis protein C